MSPRKTSNVQYRERNKNKNDYKDKLSVNYVHLNNMLLKLLLTMNVDPRSE